MSLLRCLLLSTVVTASASMGATVQKRYYAHEAVHDGHGVIAPWYTGANGQIHERVRIAAATLKRYPWTTAANSPRPLPEYMYSGAWNIDAQGKITIPPIKDWANGDLGQRAAYVLTGWVDYYRYTGDPAAISHMTLQADMLLDFELTPEDHPWPRFPVSVPVRGKPYGQANPRGFIQLDIAAEIGIPLIRAAEICNNKRWMEAARHWGDLLAEKRSRTPGTPPWGRYANPLDVPWEDQMTGGVAYILEFFDSLIRTGYTGKNNAIVEARQAGVAYLRDVLLPKWTLDPTWGRNYWDWPDAVQAQNVTEFVVRYLMEHPDEFPQWKTDARNILTLFLNHTGVSPQSRGDVYSGAWAYPESSSCCGRSLWYAPLEQGSTYAQYGALAGDARMSEIARRMMILATYDGHETGVVEDNLDGGQIVAGAWFKIAHPMVLKGGLNMIAWQPEVFGPFGENHILRSTATVTQVAYQPSGLSYRVGTSVEPPTEVILLAAEPSAVRAGGKALDRREDLSSAGYTLKPTGRGDFIATVRHDGTQEVEIEYGAHATTTQPVTPVNRYRFAEPQRWIFGYPERTDYVDAAGHPWRPATEWIVRTRDNADSVAQHWWTQRTRQGVENTRDPELYRYGAHAQDFWANVTVDPTVRKYHVRLKFMESRNIDPRSRAMDILINGKEVFHAFDIASTALALPAKLDKSLGDYHHGYTGLGRAVDLVFNDIAPQNGMIEVRFRGTYGGEAICQALEVGPGDGGAGATPTSMPVDALVPPRPVDRTGNLLANPGFEEGVLGELGAMGKTASGNGWSYLLAGSDISYLWGESAYSIHPDWGLPIIHTGKEALRTHADTEGETMVWQEIDARPATEYTASVWVLGVELHGRGFGRKPGDRASLIVMEVGEGGKLAERVRESITAPGDYRKLQRRFKTSSGAVRLRYILETRIHCPYTEGHVTYDDCYLGVGKP